MLGKKDKNKEICELCEKPLSFTRAKITSGVGDKIICYSCIRGGKLNLLCSECGKEFVAKKMKTMSSLDLITTCPDCTKEVKRMQRHEQHNNTNESDILELSKKAEQKGDMLTTPSGEEQKNSIQKKDIKKRVHLYIPYAYNT